MILEGAIGDAYGAGFEFAEREKILKFNTITQYERHPKYHSIYKKYTDDTQMAIGITELLIEKKAFTKETVTEKFIEVFQRDVRDGYSKRIYKLLSEVKTANDFFSKNVFKSDRNGAVMRVYPLGILEFEGDLLNKAAIQATVTHDTPKAIRAAQAVALASHYFIYKKGKQADLIEYISDIQQYKWEGNWKSEVTTDAMETVEAVLTILSKEKDLKSMLLESVNFGGDVDTVASISLAIASVMNEVEQNLPNWLEEELENETFGRDYIKILDEKLKAL